MSYKFTLNLIAILSFIAIGIECRLYTQNSKKTLIPKRILQIEFAIMQTQEKPQKIEIAGTILTCYEINKKNMPYLWRLIKKLTKKLQMPMPDQLLIYEETTGFSGKNAEAINPLGNYSQILIGSKLLNLLSYKEMKAILAHELGHLYLSHEPKKFATKIISLVSIVGLGSYNLIKLIGYNPSMSGMCLFISSLIGSPCTYYKLSRSFEQEADLKAATLSDSLMLESALEKITSQKKKHVYKKISTLSKIQNMVKNVIDRALQTHPTLEERKQYLATFRENL